MDYLNIVSVYMRGLNSDEKRLELYDWLNDCKINIALIQENHYVENHVGKYNSRWFGESYHCFMDSPMSTEVSILINKNLPLKIFKYTNRMMADLFY